MSNYPPGAENDPRAPYNQPDRSHEHEWVADEEPEYEHDEYVYVHQPCEYAEVIDSYTDDKRGETYYEYGWECEARRVTTYRPIWRRFPFDYDEEPVAWNECYEKAVTELVASVDWWNYPDTEVIVFVEVGGEEHQVEFELDEVNVYE